MALRAGYYGLKRFERNKLSVLAASMPADISPDNPIAGKNDVLASIDLIDNTVGWIGKNELNNDTTSFTGNNVTLTVNADKSITVSTTAEGASAQVTRVLHDVVNNGVVLDSSLVGKKFKLVGCPDGGSERTYFLQYFRYNSEKSAMDFGIGTEPFTVGEVTTGYSNIAIIIRQGTIITDPITFYPMLIDPKLYDLSPAYEPHHASVAEEIQILTERFVKVPFVTPETLSTLTKVADYPTGYNANNSVIMSFSIGGRVGVGQFSGAFECFWVTLANDGIQIFNTEQNNVGIDGYVVLGKVPSAPASANREITAEPEVKEIKKTTKKKVIKEEEE